MYITLGTCELYSCDLVFIKEFLHFSSVFCNDNMESS